MIVPYGEDAYYRLRPTLAIARPDGTRAEMGHRAIDLDGFFGLHPAMAPLLPLWQAGPSPRCTPAARPTNLGAIFGRWT